ncbi:autophagy protein atg13 [Neofusicoccum parvum]|uniref:Autophagy protein atg13 n=1 Tax=Neofusicoccum parvum TaxID=310453 RepID=A0ACB5RT26_9PEZI|nr:autophagy protein atg13 [Neofusicoccum parvum]
MAHIRSESASTATSYATARSDTGSDYIERASDGGEPDYYGGTEEERTVKKLNQVIMFSLLLDETDVYNEDLQIYLDTKDLADGEALAIVDEHGKLWDVAEALSASTPLTTRPSSRSGRPTQVVLERWTIEVTENQKMDPDANRMLPLVYKNGIPLFRSLYTYTRFLPAWKYYRHIAKQPVTQPSLPLRYRISNGQFKSPRRDTLDLPLYPAADSVAQTHQFESVKSPTGLLNISVQYRSNTEFRVEKSESVLSSHFMGMDDYSFSPSYPERVPGSLPTGWRHWDKSNVSSPERQGHGFA